MNGIDAHREGDCGYEVEPTQELHRHYCRYTAQRKIAMVLEPEGSHWKLKEPEEIASFDEFRDFWPNNIAPLIHREFATLLERGWGALQQHVVASAAALRREIRQTGRGLPPPPELFRKETDFWNRWNADCAASGVPRGPMRIQTYEEFVMCCAKNGPEFYTSMAEHREQGYDETMRQSREAVRRIVERYSSRPKIEYYNRSKKRDQNQAHDDGQQL